IFNRIIGDRLAIVEDKPGITRDRLYGTAEWAGKSFSIIDTGGIEIDGEDEIMKSVRMQAELAIAEADVIIFMVDAKIGITHADEEVAQMLRSEEHTSELQSREKLVCRLLLETKKIDARRDSSRA